MKIWILTARFGHGHYSVAKALEEELTDKGHEVVITDIVELLYPKSYKSIYNIFNHVICRNSAIYNFVNQFGRNPKETNQNSHYSTNVYRALKEIEPDMIITTWSACARVVSGCFKPVYVCITDIGVHSGWLEDHVSGYLVATKDVKKNLIQRGVPAKKIHIYGIPVRKDFKQPYIKPYSSKKKLLIMGGGLGILPWIFEVLDQLSVNPDIDITVIAGSNKKLYQQVSENYPTITTVGFTTEVYRYLREADLLISKAGGVSVFEGIYTETPFVAVFPEYEHEIENAHFIEDNSIGRVIWKGQPVGAAVMELLNNEEKRNLYLANIQKIKQELDIENKINLWCERQHVI